MAEKTLPEIRQFVVGPIETNCYALVSDGHAVVVDPGAAGARIAQELGDVTVDAVIATHGHGDHVGGVKGLVDALPYDVPFWIHEADAARASRAGTPGNLGIAYDDDAPAPARHLHDGDRIDVGDVSMRVIETPGHTPGGVVLLGDGFAFTGDTLFAGSAGRTDFPEGDHATLMASLRRLMQEVPPETVVLPGHNAVTTMERELATNPFLQ
ncbi:MBL fold metallo-hydrolase [Olsenella sp. YH-ols2217]|uniref:MBL fold metallo-hydrolase n=1 Tax=Kribbibacterium absianum TaxID=3044210 RepID=A0ABT6ZHI2_9ACTN|nr:MULTISPECIES: MBL fold metallo-hydrolase [unclassified Olsenella]MDJ1121020.1 MBL fold metallo-hydrolase [Olsenella sp. YH-ols2216]MDJ1128511.1 MBL fold metallo-hydrolase [Olsenella sp. YH-ols2217]